MADPQDRGTAAQDRDDSVLIASCPEHGLHGQREECFVCGGPVDQIEMVPLAGAQKGKEERDDMWFWRRLEEAAADFDALPAWMKKEPRGASTYERSLMADIDVRDCPKCDDGTKGSYDARVMVGGRGIFTCPACGARWQDAGEEPSSKGVPIRRDKTDV